MGKKLELAVAVLNGAVGDHLARTGNGLATAMTLVANGRPLACTRAALAAAHPEASARIVILVHGLMCTEDIWTLPDGSDYGSLLARDHGFTPLYVRYNSGLPIAENGKAFAALLDALVAAYPVTIEEIVTIGYSMGGLVVRSACHLASVAAPTSACSRSCGARCTWERLTSARRWSAWGGWWRSCCARSTIRTRSSPPSSPISGATA